MRLLLTLTTAHALLHSVKLGGPSPAAWFRDTLGIGTDGDAVCFDDGFRLRFDAAAEPTPCKLGCLGVGVELPTAEALAKAGGDAERRELTASSLPDEDAEKSETLWDVAALADRCPNILCKLGASEEWGLQSEKPGQFIKHAISVFGADRCLYESNFFVGHAAHGLAYDHAARLTYDALAGGQPGCCDDEDAVALVFAGNAKRVYGLGH